MVNHGRFITVVEAATMLGVTRQRVNQLIQAGKLKPIGHYRGGRLLGRQQVQQRSLYPPPAGRPHKPTGG